LPLIVPNVAGSDRPVRQAVHASAATPRFDAIRSDPRFQEVLAKMNFPK
jgi:hypothetical protein